MVGNPPPLSENWHFRYAFILLATPQLPTIQSILEGRNQVPPSHFRCRFTRIYVTVEKKRQLQLPFHGDFKCDGTQGCPELARGLGQEGAGPPISPFTVAFQVGGGLFKIAFVPLGCPFPVTPWFISDRVCHTPFIRDRICPTRFIHLWFLHWTSSGGPTQHKNVYCSAEKPN